MGTKMSLKTAALLLLLAFLAACDNTKQVEIGITEIRYHISNSDYEKAVAALDSIKEYLPKEMISKLEDEINLLPPVKVSVLDLVSSGSKYQGKIVEIYGYMAMNRSDASDVYFVLVDAQHKDKPSVDVYYGNCSNLREILTQDPRWNKFIPVKVVGLLRSYDSKLRDPRVSF